MVTEERLTYHILCKAESGWCQCNGLDRRIQYRRSGCCWQVQNQEWKEEEQEQGTRMRTHVCGANSQCKDDVLR